MVSLNQFTTIELIHNVCLYGSNEQVKSWFVFPDLHRSLLYIKFAICCYHINNALCVKFHDTEKLFAGLTRNTLINSFRATSCNLNNAFTIISKSPIQFFSISKRTRLGMSRHPALHIQKLQNRQRGNKIVLLYI